MSHTLRIILLWVCTLLFLFRVMAQILVGIYHPSFLPPWEAWYSGLLTYPWLLLSQLLILMFMAVVNVHQASGSGIFVSAQPQALKWIRIFGIVYVLAMIMRYALRMALMPEARWLGGTIPIWFHLVLAAWVLLVSRRKLPSE
ncbi:MAG: hypothetical protein NTV80_15140 [Verrucomicrobia bacterium]|nr:hypothetical protein [Verrucomicrobiota bacterium]